jgi:pimeloyl-ACP methyl ester carboxylesterase
MVLRWAWRVLIVLLLAAAATVALTWAPDRTVESLVPRWASAPSQFIAVQGLNVHLRDEGPRSDASPIVLIHGTGASLHTWDGWVSALRGERRVIRFDLPGYGLTGPAADGRYDSAAYVRFVIGVLDQLGVARAVIAGNSLGGNIAWHVAVAHPQRVDRLILVDAAGYALTSQSVPLGFRIARTPVLSTLMQNTLPRAVIASSVRNVYGDPHRVSDDLIDRYFDLTLRAGNRAAVVQGLAQADFGRHAQRIAEIKTPTLILWGGRDRLIPPEHAQWFARDIAASRLVVFDELGHVPHEEDAQRTVASVREFLGLPAAAR